MTLFAELKAAVAHDWQAYTGHEFVRRLGDGTLPLPVFQDYLAQDYRFLVQFARAYALAVVKSRSIADMRQAQAQLAVILDETGLHETMTGQWGIGPAQLESTVERQGTVAYTRYVLDVGHTGDLLDLNVALTPCIVGYAEIGTALRAARRDRPDHPYGAWIDEYLAPGYQSVADAAIERLDTLAGGTLTARRFGELVEVFGTCTRLEAAFWQQALDLDQALG